MRRVIDQSLGNQVNPLGLKAMDNICEVDRMPLRESRLVVRQASDSGPNIFVGCTENSEVRDQPAQVFCNQNEKRKKRQLAGKFGRFRRFQSRLGREVDE